MIDTVALREKVLDLAIRGKLVPQDPNDEPASVLLERIRAQKQQMVKDGKLKPKDIKDDSIIFVGEDNLHYEKFADGTVKCIKDEIPFELPQGWEWTRIGNIAIVKGGKRVPKGMTFSAEPTHHAYVRVTDMKNHTVNLSDLKYIDEAVFSEIKNYTISKNDLYITIAGTIGAVGEFPDELDGMNLTENAVKVTAIALNKTFLCLMMQTEYVQKQFKHKTYQVAMPKLGLERILTTLIPVCGLTVQDRICKAVNNTSIYIDLISENYIRLSDTIPVIKSKILDLAIRGKLVPQDSNDEPASLLLERIRAEKEELIKQGKIKRDKKESVIFRGEDNSYYLIQNERSIPADETIVFDLPDSWCWTTLPTIANVELGKTLDRAKNTGMLYPYLRSVNIKWGDIDLSDLNETRFEDDELEKYSVIKNDLLICEGGDVGRCCVWNIDEVFLYQNALHRARMYANIEPKFYQYVLMSYESKGILKRISNGVTIKHLTRTTLSFMPIPLPPLDEQLRIIETIELLFAQLDVIKESLN